MKTCAGMALLLAALPLSSLHADDVVRYPLMGGSKFPIARAVEIPAGTTLIFHSGIPKPAPFPARAPWCVT